MRSARPAAAARSRASAACSSESVSPVTRAPNSPAAWRAKPPQPQPISSTWLSGPRPSFSQMRRYLASWASSSVISGPLEDRARVRPRRVEEERVEVVAEVVVVRDVPLRRRSRPWRAGSFGRRRWNPVSARPGRLWRAPLGGDGQDLEQADQVVGPPVAGDVRLAHRQAAAGGEPAPEVLRRDRHLDVRARRRVAAAPHRAVRAAAPRCARARGGPAPGARARRATGARGRARRRRLGAQRAPRATVAGGRGGRRRARPLAGDEPRLVVERHLLHRELHRLPVDEAGHLLGHERVPRQRPGDRRVGEGAPPAGQLGPERALAALDDARRPRAPARPAP